MQRVAKNDKHSYISEKTDTSYIELIALNYKLILTIYPPVPIIFVLNIFINTLHISFYTIMLELKRDINQQDL